MNDCYFYAIESTDYDLAILLCPKRAFTMNQVKVFVTGFLQLDFTITLI